jgi:O-acetyl-ADP-ribose deacetylase
VTPPALEVLDADIATLAVDVIARDAATAPPGAGRGAPAEPGDVAAATAGDLPSRWVIDAATAAPSADVVRRATAATLWKAEELGARSLALVAFGGPGGFPVADAAAIEVDEARRHLESGSRLERIVFAVRGEAARQAFEAALAAA